MSELLSARSQILAFVMEAVLCECTKELITEQDIQLSTQKDMKSVQRVESI